MTAPRTIEIAANDLTPPRGGSLADLLAYYDTNPLGDRDLIEGIFDAGMTAIIGLPEAGKGRFKSQSMRSMVTGESFLGREVRPGNHRIVSYNTDPGEQRREARKLQQLIPADLWDRIELRTPPGPDDKAGWRREVSRNLQARVTVVYFDNIFGALTGSLDTVRSDSQAPILDRLTDFVAEDLPVVVVAHTNASGSASIAGNTLGDARVRGRLHISGDHKTFLRRVDVAGNELPRATFHIRTTAYGVELVSEAVGSVPMQTQGRKRGKSDLVTEAIREAQSDDDAVARMVAAGTNPNASAAKKYLDRRPELRHWSS